MKKEKERQRGRLIEKQSERQEERERESVLAHICVQSDRETARASERAKESECARARVNECVYTLTRHTSDTHASKRQYQPRCITKPTDRGKYKANTKSHRSEEDLVGAFFHFLPSVMQ